MKKFLIFMLPIMLFNCNNEVLEADNQSEQNDVVLIPKKVTLVANNIVAMYMNYLEDGRAISFENTAAVPYKTFTYNEMEQLTNLYEYDGQHYSIKTFEYQDELTSIIHNSGGTFIQDITYDGNKIIMLSLFNTDVIEHYVFETNAHLKLLRVDQFDISDPETLIGYILFTYDENNNPIKREHFIFNDNTLQFDLTIEVIQEFDTKNNPFKHTEKLSPAIEKIVFPVGFLINHFDFVNRAASNNVLHRDFISYTSGYSSYELNFEYIYNEDDYPIEMNQVNWSRIYTYEYYEN